MEFCKFPFLPFFLAVFLVYWRLRDHGWRMGWLLLASAAYYASFHPAYLLLLLASTAIDYVVALRLPTAGPARRRLLLALSVGVNLGVLAFFKYLHFALRTARTAAGWLGWGVPAPGWQLALPLGISFYTFEAISYVVDVYRGKLAPLRSPRDYLLYILFFPHLLAGPIVRSGDFAPQLHRRKRFSWVRLEAGVRLFVLGLFKKAVLADWMAPLVDPVFADPGAYSTPALWLATLAYAVQIYGDFSGYSDMAIGLAHMLGFKLPANFRQPYLATSITEFWRRWHVSLSTWLRDYLYIPLGGSRHGAWITCRALLATMLLGGLWHGASWTFVLWGLYHGVLLVVARVVPVPGWLAGRWLAPARAALTFLVVCVGWVLFRSPSFAAAGTALAGMAVPTGGRAFSPGEATAVLLALACVVGGGWLGATFDLRKLEKRLPAPVAAAGLAAFAMLYVMLLPDRPGGFIYFRF